MSTKTYNLRKSHELLERALKLIPLGSQTFSKSYIQYPMENAPRFIDHAHGCTVTDVDGNQYIDLVSSLAAIVLGYCDPDVDAAVGAQLTKGVVFTLPHELEIQVAEKIVELSPNAEQVRFGKNGSDVTTAAVRLARAITKKDRVAVCGYHGWHDWFIGSTTMNLGVPGAAATLTHSFTYNDIASLEHVLETHPNQFAAIVMEVANVTAPENQFLENVKALAKRHGALLIFDETITGFRYALGGAQEKFGIHADLVTYGKALANGYPLSAIAGPREYMQHIDKIFFSSTFGGEALSLAASLATLQKLQRLNVPSIIAERGKRFQAALRHLVHYHAMENYCSITGDPSWFFIVFKDVGDISTWEIKTLFMQEMIRRGVLSMGTHNLSLSHDDAVIDRLLDIYGEVLPLVAKAVQEQSVVKLIEGKPLKPLFTIRKA